MSAPQRCYVCAEPGLLFGDLCPGCAALVHDIIGIPAHCHGKDIPCEDCTAFAWQQFKAEYLLTDEAEINRVLEETRL